MKISNLLQCMPRMLLALSAGVLVGAAPPQAAEKPPSREFQFPKVIFLPIKEGDFTEIRKLFSKGDFAEARAAIDVKLKSESDEERRTALHLMRAVADAELKDKAAYRLDIEAAAKFSSSPETLLPQMIIHASDFDEPTAIGLTEQYARKLSAEGAATDEVAVWRLTQWLFQTGHRKVYDELILSLASVSYGSVQSKEQLYQRAAEVLGARGEIPKALEYAHRIRQRDGLIDVLTDRRYEPLWADLDRTSSDKLENIGKEELASAKEKFRTHPDLATRLQLMQAYGDLEMWVEADRLGKQVGRNRDELMALTETTAFLVDIHADILLHTEGLDAADKRRAELIETWTAQRPWVISMAINRIGRLLEAHRYQQSLALLDEQKWQLENYSTDYAKQLLRYVRLGSLMGLGRRSEAVALVPDILAHADDAPAATLASLLLAGKDSEAERLALAWLKDDRHRTTVLSFLRVDDTSRVDDPLTERLRTRFRSRPAVAKAFNENGRDLPERFRRVD